MLGPNENILENLFKSAEFSKAEIFEGSDIKGYNPIMDIYYEYWYSKQHNGRIPRRSDIRPQELRDYLPYAALMDVRKEPGPYHDFRLVIRLLGTHIADAFGEITGCDATAIPNPATAKRVYHMAALVRETGTPAMSHVRDYGAERERMEVCALYMPLSETGERVDKVFAAAQFWLAEHEG